ncbi:winged helix DNA-binding protein [Leucobacter weissii]|uniref:Winged helix DNA-binding protein n=1 Tax=Leucobacter weissii TaxID=1983706 RepID=A0A939MPC5_9MICO|nr:winged helix DNA-binding protein [Leucobacter weissii]
MDEPRWLTEDERHMWMRLVALTILLPAGIESQLKRDAGLSFFEYHVLAMLSEADGRRRLMSELAFWTNSSLSRLSHVVTRLEKPGWVRREACETDGRAINAVLTDAGFAHLKASAPAHVSEVRRLALDRLAPDDVGVLSEILAKMLDAVDPDGRRTPGT